MNRLRARRLITILVVIALVSGSIATIIGALSANRQELTATILPEVILTPDDVSQVGMGSITSVAYAGSSFVFFPDSAGKERAQAAGGATIELNSNSSSPTVLAGSFTQPSVCTEAFNSYRTKASSTAFALDAGASVIGERSARYSDSAGAALLVEKEGYLIALVYELNSTSSASAARYPITALEALARILVARL